MSSRWVLIVALFFIVTADAEAAKLQPQTLRAWDAYAQLTEQRIASELNSSAGFLRIEFMPLPEAARTMQTIKGGRVAIQKMTTRAANGKEIDVPDGMMHHWLGAIFIPNIKLQTVIQWVQNYDQHQRYFKEVEQSKLVSRDGDTFKIFLRFVRKKVVTVHYNTHHTVVYRTHADDRVSSRSFTTRIAELEDPGTSSEKEKPIGDDSGFFWRLNSYWRLKEIDGGVVVECESISLSRSIPFGFGWLIKGFIESVPRESLESTLVSTRDGIKR